MTVATFFGSAGCTLLILLSSKYTKAQSVNSETSLAIAVQTAQKRYAESFVGHPQLYSGPEYMDYAKAYHARVGHQFFLVSEMQQGSVYYNGHQFANVPLKYDVVHDQVVLVQPTSPITLRLIDEKVLGFTFNNHRFVRLRTDSISGNLVRTGYYELLADGRIQLLAKRSKRMQEQIVQRYVDVEFILTDKLYIKKGGNYYAAGRKASVLRLLSDHSVELQKFMQDQHLSFKSDSLEASISRLVAYYNSLPRP